MTRKQTYGLAAIATAALSIAGTWSLVHAQQAAPAGAPAAGNNRNFPGQAGPAGISPMGGRGMPGMNSGMSMGGQMGMAPPQEFDPEMAELAEAEATLAAHAEELLAEYAAMDFSMAKDPTDAQKTFKAKLRETLAKQFDAQKQRRNLELTRIEERVEKLREQIKKRNDARETIIDRRLEQLVNEADGLGWGQPTGPNARGMMGPPGKAANNKRR